MMKITTALGLQKVVVGHNNRVVGLTGFSCKKMSGLLFGPQKSGRRGGRINRVIVWWTSRFHCPKVVY